MKKNFIKRFNADMDYIMKVFNSIHGINGTMKINMVNSCFDWAQDYVTRSEEAYKRSNLFYKKDVRRVFCNARVKLNNKYFEVYEND